MDKIKGVVLEKDRFLLSLHSVFFLVINIGKRVSNEEINQLHDREKPFKKLRVGLQKRIFEANCKP